RSPDEISEVLAAPHVRLPEMEYRISVQAPVNGRVPRFDTINHFFPRPDQARVPITVMGRLFGEYEALHPRRRWHTLTEQIHAHKEARQFPDAWIQAIRSYLARVGGGDCLVTVIPFKPGRTPRMEALLDQ